MIHAHYSVNVDAREKGKTGLSGKKLVTWGQLDAQSRYFNCQEVKRLSSEVISEYFFDFCRKV